MNYNLALLLLGLIFGYFIMYISSNIVRYHGYNSNDIRNTIFIKDGKKYMFVPKIKQVL